MSLFLVLSVWHFLQITVSGILYSTLFDIEGRVLGNHEGRSIGLFGVLLVMMGFLDYRGLDEKLWRLFVLGIVRTRTESF